MQGFTLLISVLFLFMPFSFLADVNGPKSENMPWAEHEPLSFMLSPNPVHRDCVLDVNQEVDLLILDIRGKEVFRLSNFKGGDLELGHLEEGIYFLQLITPAHVRTQRLIKVSDKG